MKLHPSDGAMVQWIEGISFQNKLVNIHFESGYYRAESNGYRAFVSGKLYEPQQVCRLSDVIELGRKISVALKPTPYSLKKVAGATNSRFILSYFDTDAELFDVIEFFADNSVYHYDERPQLVDIDDWEPFDPQFRNITIAVVRKSE